MNNKLLLAGAGTGKTTYIVNEALKSNERILITTYTLKCRDEIKNKIISLLGYIPNNIVVQTWFSFLLEHGIKPYKKDLNIKKINGICFVEGKSGFRYYNKKGYPVYYGETEFQKHYFDDNNRIYTDKISKLVMRIDEASNGLVFERIGLIFKKIYIDEVQDFVGYDLEIIKKISETCNSLVVVGDPRQNVYNTHCDSKYDKYSSGKIHEFILNECENSNFKIDLTSLNICRRCHKDIVSFLNHFYPDYGKLESIDIPPNNEQGIFIVRTKDVEKYLEKFNPVQLRYSIRTKVSEKYKSENYRNSKGATYNRTLIYPTNDFREYLKSNKRISSDITRNAIYVALSRAIDSVAIVYDGSVNELNNINIWGLE